MGMAYDPKVDVCTRVLALVEYLGRFQVK